MLTALAVSIAGALSIETLRARRTAAGDQALALVFYTGIAGGVVLVSAAGALNVIAAARIAWSMRSTMVLAMGIGLASVLTGITVAYYADLPPGGTTVLVTAAAVLVAEPIGALRR